MPNVKKDGELSIYVERMMRFLQLLRIYEMVLALPREEDSGDIEVSMRGTMMGVVYSFFYSLIEENSNAIDFFRIWKEREPEMKAELEALEARVEPVRDPLRRFRNRYGFHGSTSREHEAPAFELLKEFDGATLHKLMLDVRDLSTKLIQRRTSKVEAN